MTLEALGRAGGSGAWGAAEKGHREAWLPASDEKAPCPPPPTPQGCSAWWGRLEEVRGPRTPLSLKAWL